MRAVGVIVFVLFFSFFVVAQKKKEFTENVSDFFSKTDTLPFFIYEKAELDTLFALNRIIPVNAELYGVKCEEHVGFKVTRDNKIASVKHYYTDIVLPNNVQMNEYNYYDSLKLYFQKETERLLKITEGLWFTDSTKSTYEVKRKILYISDGFDKLNHQADANYFNTKGKTTNKTIELGSPASIMSKTALYNIGVRKFAIKRTALAKVYFNESIKYFPKDIDAHYNLATCYLKLKDNVNACKHFNKCLELGDKTVTAELDKYCK